ncbi:putative transposable element [Trichonephila clavipes]|nr:putative transposable element [Trichonephila clavipes]
MITNFFIPELNNHGVQELWFQQDGVTCHTARATIDLLKDTFGDRLISRFGPVNWPPRYCDLTPLDYFLWGCVKSLVYADKPQTPDPLEDNIRRVIADIRPQMLEKVIENWTSRLDYIRASRGSPMPEIIFKISCDLTPLDYFLWGYVKSLVYADKPQTLDHLEDNICRVIVDIRPQMLEKVMENWTSRLDFIRASRGSPMPEIILKICQVIYSQFGLAIHQNDHQARRRFVEWAQNEIAVVPDFHKRILFSDEAHFWLNGYVNKQNCRIWSEANLQVYVETPLHPEKLTVWCALWAGGILLQKR